MNKVLKWTAIGIAAAAVAVPLVRRYRHPVAETVRDNANAAVTRAEGLVDSVKGA